MAYIGREPTFGAFETQDFVGTGSQTDFTLDFVVSTASSLAVWVNNVSQVPNTQFNTIGNILRFVTAPANSATIKVVYLGRQHSVPTQVTVLDNSITTNKIASNAVNSTKIDIFKDTPNASSIYEIIDSTDKGVLFAPKLTEAQRDAISGPATGLVLYNTDKNKLNIYNGSKWENLGGSEELSATNAADIFTNFVKDMEDHGRTSIHTEAGFVDEFEASNDMIDESNSSGFRYDATDDLYSNVGLGLNSNVEYTTESNYIQQEWTNSNQSTSQATVSDILSDTTLGQTFTTDNPIQSGVIGNAFDDSNATSVGFFTSTSPNSLLPRHIAVEYTSAKTVTKVTINCNGSEGRGQNVTFKIQGSNDNSNWTDLHTETGYNFATGNSSTDDFTFSNSTPYLHYRIRWENSAHTAANPSQNGGFPTMYEIEMMESVSSVTLSSGTWFTNCDNGRISFDSGSTWFDISSRDSNIQLKLTTTTTNGTFDYIIRLSEFDSGKIQLNEFSGTNPINEYTSIITKESFNTNVTDWTDINSSSVTESGSGNAHYWLGFDPASGYGAGTEAKIFHQADSVWRTIAKNNAGTWEYNSSETDKTELLLNANGSDGATTMTVEGKIGGAFTFFDNAQLDTAVKKFGTSSIQFDGIGDYVQSTNNNSAFNLGTDDFTIDYWINWSTVTDGIGIWGFGGIDANQVGGGFYCQTDSGVGNGNLIYLYFFHPTLSNWASTGSITLPGGTATAGTWYHHAFVKQGSVITFYENGVTGGNTGSTILNNGDLGSFTEPKWCLGRRLLADVPNSGNFLDGHIDSFRVTRGVRFTSNFNSSLPTEPVYNSSGADTFTGTSAGTNDMLHAVSQAVSTVSDNRMSKADIEAITDAEFEASNGFNSSTHTSLFRGVTLNSTNVTNNISVDSYGLNYDFNGAIDLRTKQWTGTGGTPSAPSASPDTIYLFVVDEHTTGTPQYQVTRDGSTYINVTFDRDWVFSGTKRARRATIDISSQPAGTDPRVKITTLVSDDFKLHAVGLQTKS